MALSVAQILASAQQQALTPGYDDQAGQKLNLILQELAQSYDIVSAQWWISGTFLTSPLVSTVNSANVVAGSGPYALPADFLRFDFGDFFWQNGGINYFPTPLVQDEFDRMIQQPGFSSYPTAYFVDTSTSPYGLYIWPAASAAYPYFGRYRRQMSDIASPATSTSIPWFPSQMYLERRLTGEMMLYTGDQRALDILQDAKDILKRFLERDGNSDTRAITVKLDPRSFGKRWTTTPSSKQVPW